MYYSAFPDLCKKQEYCEYAPIECAKSYNYTEILYNNTQLLKTRAQNPQKDYNKMSLKEIENEID